MITTRTSALKKIYGTGESAVAALNGVDISVEEGAFIAVVGKSGSGKSTLLHMVGGLDSPTSGEVYIGEENITNMPEKKLSVFRRKNIGFVFQFLTLFRSLTQGRIYFFRCFSIRRSTTKAIITSLSRFSA